MLKRTPLSRKTPLTQTKPLRRGPMRRKARPAVPAAEKAHMARIAAMPCLVCGGTATVHHVTASIHGGRLSRSNWRVVPLCPAHHQIQHAPRESVEALGHSGFWVLHGIDLLAEAERLANG